MKSISYLLFAGILILSSCSLNSYPVAENGLVASQYFLQSCMKGDFKQAAFYILPDSVNKKQLQNLQDAYYHNTSDQRVEYRNANIIIDNDETVDPNTEIISYKNSYDKIARKVKAVKVADGWKIDLKYTFSGNF